MKNESTCPACGAPLTFPGDGKRAVCEFCGYTHDLTESELGFDAAEASVDEYQAASQPDPEPAAQPVMTAAPYATATNDPEPFPNPIGASQPPSGTNWKRVGIGCLSGCGSALVLGFGCGVMGLIAERMMRMNGAFPGRGLVGLAVIVALVIGLVVFLAVAFTGKKRS